MTAAPTSSTNAQLASRFVESVMPTYGEPPVALTRGEGCRVWDIEGQAYLDMIGGIAVSVLGHNHPSLVEAVSDQVSRIAHTSNLFVHEPGVRLAERLLDMVDDGVSSRGRVFFTNSGTEANEAALKLVLKARDAAQVEPPQVVAAEGGFHGRTMGALALTGKPGIRDPFGPFGVDVRFVPYGDFDALREAVTSRCAAVFTEPCLGESGVVPAPAGYLAAAREVCDVTGAALVIDEIQGGIGRTGRWFAHQHENVRPDIVTVAKGLGGGLPLGACIGLGRFGVTFAKGDHGATFGGNPVACAAAHAVLDTIEREELLSHVDQVGDLLTSGIDAVRHPLLAGVRGRGLWHGMLLSDPVASRVEEAARNAGFLLNAVRPDVIRLAPPLLISADEVRMFLAALPAILDEAQELAGNDARKR